MRVPRAGIPSSAYSNELANPPRSLANGEQEALEQADYHMLFGAGADDPEIDWTLGVADT